MAFFFNRAVYSTAVRCAPAIFCNPFSKKTRTVSEPDCEEEWEVNWDWREGITSRGTNHYFLIRHGQYYERGANKERISELQKELSPKGKQQAGELGKYLLKFFQDHPDYDLDQIISSDMLRAKQTAWLAYKEFRGARLQGDWFNGCGEPRRIPAYVGLGETTPYFTLDMIEQVGDNRDKIAEINENEDTLNTVARQIFRRPTAQGGDDKNSVTLIFAHANVIRYLVLRLLQMPRERWHRFSLNHCAITWLKVDERGYVTCRTFGDISWMPMDLKSRVNAKKPRLRRGHSQFNLDYD